MSNDLNATWLRIKKIHLICPFVKQYDRIVTQPRSIDGIKKVETRVMTYGTFDLFHIGHLRLLQRIRMMGTHITVGLSTDGFNNIKGKKAVDTYERRRDHVMETGLVNRVIPEERWDQKIRDIRDYRIDLLVMGSDWMGEFDFLKDYCKVCYLPRTSGISSTFLRELMSYKG